MPIPPTPKDTVEILSKLYGQPEWKPGLDSMDTLVHCILSQNTSDANSFPAFEKLKQKYADWDALLTAPHAEVAEVIHSSGFANQKAKRIQACLDAVKIRYGKYDLTHLKEKPLDEARAELMDLPGIGPKCAAIILCFALGMPAIPVDTHVFRVGWRLGYYEKKVGESKAHDILQQLIPVEVVYAFHVCLINHGREICRAINPKCGICPLKNNCGYTNGNQ